MNKSDTISFHACNPSGNEGLSNTWFTPPEIFEPLGEFDLDPCTQSFKPYEIAHKNIYHDLNECGLLTPWYGRVWLNPPYGKNIGLWLDKLEDHGNGIALVFSRTETKWAQKHLKACDAVLFLNRRIKFIREDKIRSTNNAANGSMILAYGSDNVNALSSLDGIIFYN